MMGAIFMKFGRAPAMRSINTVIAQALQNSYAQDTDHPVRNGTHSWMGSIPLQKEGRPSHEIVSRPKREVRIGPPCCPYPDLSASHGFTGPRRDRLAISSLTTLVC